MTQLRKLRILVVDDDPLARKMIVSVLSADESVFIVGEAKDGQEAIVKTAELRPDLITMDIEMPVMGGLEAIEHIMMSTPVPILVVSSHLDVETAAAAVARGALEVVDKPDVKGVYGNDLLKKVRLLAEIRVILHIKSDKSRLPAVAISHPGSKDERFHEIIAIVSSTGGPPVIADILSHLPGDYPLPIVIAQHIANGFAAGMVNWLNSRSLQEVVVPETGTSLHSGRVYIAPPEFNMKIDGRRKILLCERKPNELYRPSCNALLDSVAAVYGAASVGVILTGMGNDGVSGMQSIKKAGGVTIAQDEISSLVFGMPALAIESGSIDKVLPPKEIAAELVRLARHASRPDNYVNKVRP